jgi:thioredoxin 1
MQASSALHVIANESDLAQAMQASHTNLVLIDIYGSWCQPCKKLEPKLNEMAQHYAQNGLLIFKNNVETNLLPASGLPTILFYQQGQVQRQIMGCDADAIERTIREMLGVVDDVVEAPAAAAPKRYGKAKPNGKDSVYKPVGPQ